MLFSPAGSKPALAGNKQILLMTLNELLPSSHMQFLVTGVSSTSPPGMTFAPPLPAWHEHAKAWSQVPQACSRDGDLSLPRHCLRSLLAGSCPFWAVKTPGLKGWVAVDGWSKNQELARWALADELVSLQSSLLQHWACPFKGSCHPQARSPAAGIVVAAAV